MKDNREKKRTLSEKLNFVVKLTAIVMAIVYSIYTGIWAPRNLYEYMIISLLVIIATNSLLDQISFYEKFNDFINSYNDEKGNGKDRVYSFDNSDACANMLNSRITSGIHCIDVVSLDQKTRTQKKVPKKHLVMNMLDMAADNIDIRLRYIYVPGEKNFLRILNRINKGNCNNSFFSYIDNKSPFPFASFIIIDNNILMTRSPYEPSNASEYLVLENDDILKFYKNWFNTLWAHSIKIDSKKSLEELYENYKDILVNEEKIKAIELIKHITFNE